MTTLAGHDEHASDLSRVPAPIRPVRRAYWRDAIVTDGERLLAEEIPIAVTYNGSAHAVMMATPCDLEDFAIGFSLSEGIVSVPDQIETVEIISSELGIELRISIAQTPRQEFYRRRRYLAGPTGCGLCGVESLADALPPLRYATSKRCVTAGSIHAALEKLASRQHLNRQTHALHAAGFANSKEDLIVREDVGRHNALDKLAGALARCGIRTETGFVVLSSRVSIEMVQKTAAMRVPILVAISAPTALAVRMCESAGLTLIGIARRDGFEVFTHPERIGGRPAEPIAETGVDLLASMDALL